MTKYIFVTGGVVSGLGKGVTAATLGLLLKMRGYKVFMQKFDPYLNFDPGTMSPYQHGEVFVTADGTETDLDLGHYERFIDEELNYTSNVTAGKIYYSVINKERTGDYLGKTVQIIPHITNEIKNRIFEAAKTSKADIVIIEIGGTIGDIESLSFLEAIRQVRNDLGIDNTMFVHTTLIPYIVGSDELKTKPTQHSVTTLRSYGIQPDALVCRTPSCLDKSMKDKLSLYCSVKANSIIDAVDVDNIYRLPLKFFEQKADLAVCDHFKLKHNTIELKQWKNLIKTFDNLDDEVEISLVGKYVELHDAYISIVESLKHAGYGLKTKIKINWVNSEELEKEKNLAKIFSNTQGILVPGGFGNRGIKGKIMAIKYARENDVPFLGICLGMQLACIEFASNVCHVIGADSREFDENAVEPVIDLMLEQKDITQKGGTQRLGNYPCSLVKNTIAHNIYNQDKILERHRHRYEFNNKYIDLFEKNGLVFSGKSPNGHLIEMIELPKLKHFVACQFHPEFKSRPIKPHPLFSSFIKAAIESKTKKEALSK